MPVASVDTRRSHQRNPKNDLTLWDKLSRLTYHQACKLLGENGEALIRAGGAWEIDLDEQVKLDKHRFCLTFPLAANEQDIGHCGRDCHRNGTSM